jgi:hypothetical protein
MRNLFRRPRKPAPPRPPARARLVVEQLESRTVPSTSFTVVTLANAGTGSLRDAIDKANNTAGADTIAFAPGLSGTIALTSGGELLITDSVTITGPGAGVITVSGNNTSRIFEVDNNAAGAINVTISGLTLAGGKADDGGAIVASDEVLTLNGVAIIGNTATDAGGGMALGSFGQVTLVNSIVAENTAAADGGGISSNASLLTLVNSTVSGNQAVEGGGIQIGGNDQLTLVNSTVSGNQAVEGGGIALGSDGQLTLENSSVSDNHARDFGGALFLDINSAALVRNSTISGNSAVSSGGGILAKGATTTVENSTISGNSSRSHAGGIEVSGGSATIRNSTIAFNTADADTAGGGKGGGLFVDVDTAVRLLSTIVADNAVGATGAGPDVSGAVTAAFSLLGNTAGTAFLLPGSANNMTGVDPLLGPLANNGGPTKTHALLPGSPAIGHGANPAGLSTDQRGSQFLRAFGRGVDIGAFELVIDAPMRPAAQSIQAAVQAIQFLQPSGAHLAAAAFADLSGDFVTDIVLAIKLKSGKLLVVSFDGFSGQILSAFLPFPARLQAGARVQLLTLQLGPDPGFEVILLINQGGPNVPRVSVFSEAGTRLL